MVQGRSGDTALKPHPGTFHNGLGLDDFYNFSWLSVHRRLQWDSLPGAVTQQENISIIISHIFGVMEYWSAGVL